MTTITIPKKFAKDDLVIIPLKEYEKLLARPNIPTFKPTPAQKRDLLAGRKEYAQGKSITLGQLKRDLGITNKKKR